MKWFLLAATFSFISAATLSCSANDGHADGVIQPTLAVPLYRYYDRSTEEDDEDLRPKSDSDRKKKADDSNKTWTRKSIHETRINIRETHEVSPDDRSSELNYGGSEWSQFYASPKVFAWAAPDIRYQPLYFEDVALERYGQTMGWYLQPYRSGIHFFKSFVFLPNQMRHDHPNSCDHPLGFCRPGTCVPGIQQQQFFGFSVR